MDYYRGLKRLGFIEKYDADTNDFDYYILNEKLYWQSSQPQPSDAEIQEAVDQALADEQAKVELRQSMITKLATTLTPEETALLEELL
jgi:hypothetical protein